MVIEFVPLFSILYLECLPIFGKQKLKLPKNKRQTKFPKKKTRFQKEKF